MKDQGIMGILGSNGLEICIDAMLGEIIKPEVL